MTQVVWFRRDLRVADHPALHAAAAAGPVVCVFVIDPAILGRRHHDSPNRLAFLSAGLRALDGALRERGSGLVILHGDPAECLVDVAREHGAERVRALREITPLGRDRDERVGRALADAGAAFDPEPGDLVAEPEDIPGSADEGYQVFTPFSKVWFDVPLPDHIPAPERIDGPPAPELDLGDLPRDEPLLPAGPDAARERLVAFIAEGHADAYGDARNDLSGDATSVLSPYLRFGMTTGAAIGRALGLPGTISKGRMSFWRQVAWREFAHHLMARRPIVATAAMRPELRDIEWERDQTGWAAWCAGRTGYPLVDAGMRQLVGSGWMHNRARMVVASFLVKDLLIDWRRGESFFMRHLIDGDPGANNFGWQWTAGTGADAAPYFRVFNPIRQSERFDPDGDYIRRWVPELAGVTGKKIHEPWTLDADEQAAADCVIGTDYPEPIVDHASARERTLERYAAAKDAAA